MSYGHQTFIFFKNIGEKLALRKRGLPFSIDLFVLGNSLQINLMLQTSVADPDLNPDPSDPYVFGPTGSGSGSFYHQAKIGRKEQDSDPHPDPLVRGMMIRGSRSGSAEKSTV